MKNILSVSLFFLSFSLVSLGQEKTGAFQYSGSQNFNLIKQQADEFFKVAAAQPFGSGVKEDNEYFKYKRWEWYWKNRVSSDGSFPDMTKLGKIHEQLQSENNSTKLLGNAQWVNISQTSAPGGYNGMGRLTSIAFHPTDPKTFWVGAPIGGIWKTTDGGLSYSPLGDKLPYCSVGNIVVDHQNPNTIYITIGDHVGWWNYGLGVYKTTDGGQTWNATSLNSSFSNGVAYYAMVISPTNPNILLVAATNGLHRSTDGGNTWTIVRTGSHRDVKFRVNDGNTIYASSGGTSEVYKSTDAGASWAKMSSFGFANNTIRLSVTLADPNYLGILCSRSGVKEYYLSTNNGAGITLKSTAPEEVIVQISPNNVNTVYCGNLNIQKSTNGGTSWTQLTHWYNNNIHVPVHADQHFVACNPLNKVIYFCNDGGLFSLTESTNTWAELTNGLIITQFYTIAISQSDPVFMIGGTQDNGGRKRTGINIWAATNGGDAMETAINQTNDQIIYTTYVNGQLYRSMDRWKNDTYNDITPAGVSGDWVTPYVLDPNNQSTVFVGYEDVYKSTNQGTAWTKISTNLTGSSSSKLQCLEVSPANSSRIYASRGNKFYATSNGGTSWQTYTLSFTTSSFTEVTSITSHPTNATTVYITVGGYSATKKVYKSTDGGINWTNKSGTLPNVPASSGIYDENSTYNDFYIGTDVGVFLTNDTASGWIYWGTDMPNTSITDLEIHKATGKIRAGTYGRGIWEADLNSSTATGIFTSIKNENNFSPAFNPVSNVVLLNASVKNGANYEIQICDITGKIISSNPTYFPAGNYQIPLDVSTLYAGIFLVRLASESQQVSFKLVKLS